MNISFVVQTNSISFIFSFRVSNHRDIVNCLRTKSWEEFKYISVIPGGSSEFIENVYAAPTVDGDFVPRVMRCFQTNDISLIFHTGFLTINTELVVGGQIRGTSSNIYTRLTYQK